jgi:hypothetical protein
LPASTTPLSGAHCRRIIDAEVPACAAMPDFGLMEAAAPGIYRELVAMAAVRRP